MKCLVIGASGQLGRALCAELRQGHEVVEAAFRAPQPGQRRVDLADPDGVRGVLAQVKPDWVLIAGVLGNVDRAEAEPELCFRINTEGPWAVAEWAQGAGAAVVYYSSDYVFDGTWPSYTEDNAPHPLNVYGRSKAQAEAALRQLLPDRHLIIRTTWLYGPDENRRNFVMRLVDDLRAKRSAPVPSDQWGTPTYTGDVAAATKFLLEHGRIGTFHAAGPDFLDRAAFAGKICEQFELDDRLVVPTPTNQLGQTARRPLQARLETSKLADTGAAPFRGVEAGLKALRQWEESLQLRGVPS